MRKNQARSRDAAGALELCVAEPRTAPGAAPRMRILLQEFVQRSAEGRLPVHLPGAAGGGLARGAGHFHLAPELFLQVAGWTDFSLPHQQLRLNAGQALLLPPKLLHAERVGTADTGEAFCNLVIYAEAPALTCHLAHEAAPARPGILHLEARRHLQAAHIHDWLGAAARLARPDDGAEAASPWAAAQLRSLVAAALAGVLCALDDPGPGEAAEPALVARVRVLIKNQLGDSQLSVRRLAEQSGCTPDYLSHVFSRSTGEHLAGFIVGQRMERAARLLDESSMAGKEVAWACGYTTPSYFNRSFRAHYGLTPGAWRAGHAAAA
jgi:AraC-like DNA-binding protein